MKIPALVVEAKDGPFEEQEIELERFAPHSEIWGNAEILNESILGLSPPSMSEAFIDFVEAPCRRAERTRGTP
jgi:hypothetical protein